MYLPITISYFKDHFPGESVLTGFPQFSSSTCSKTESAGSVAHVFMGRISFLPPNLVSEHWRQELISRWDSECEHFYATSYMWRPAPTPIEL